MPMRCAIVLFNRDLRLHDHPALHEAMDRAERVIPLFVIDDRLTGTSPNRTSFLLDALTDLRSQLRRRGGDLVVRRGDPVDETLRIARRHHAEAVFTSHDVTPLATRRQHRLTEACASERIDFETRPGVTIVPAGLAASIRWRPLPRVHAVLASVECRTAATSARGSTAPRPSRSDRRRLDPPPR